MKDIIEQLKSIGIIVKIAKTKEDFNKVESFIIGRDRRDLIISLKK